MASDAPSGGCGRGAARWKKGSLAIPVSSSLRVLLVETWVDLLPFCGICEWVGRGIKDGQRLEGMRRLPSLPSSGLARGEV